MSNIIDLPVITTLPLDPKRVLGKACDVDFERVMVIGYTKDGDDFASSEADGGTCLWDMERAKHALMRIADDA